MMFLTDCLFLPVSHVYFKGEITHATLRERQRRRKRKEQACVKLSDPDSHKITSVKHQPHREQVKKDEYLLPTASTNV